MTSPLLRLLSNTIPPGVLPVSFPPSVVACVLTSMTLSTDTLNHEPVMSALQVPIEIILRILDLANSPSPDLKLLQSCSLACKAWSAHAQKMLFRSVSMSTHRQYTALVAAFQPHAPERTSTMVVHKLHLTKPSLIAGVRNFPPTHGFTYSNVLRGSVTELNVIIDFNQPDGLTFAELSHLVALCPNLRKIGISVFGIQPQGMVTEGVTDQWRMKRLAPPVPDEVLEELRTAPNASRISELRVHDWSDDSKILPQLLGIWPHITTLRIAGKLPATNQDADSALFASTLDTAPCALEMLSLNCATGTESTADFVKWLLAGSRRTLRRLEFLKEPSTKLLEDIFAHSTFPLDSVSLPSCACPAVGQIIRDCLGPTFVRASHDDQIGEDDTLVRVQGLKELFIEDPSTPLRFLASAVRSDTVQRFGFGVDGRTDLSSIARTIKTQTGLKRIAVWFFNGGERNLGLGSLRIACAMNGIELEETRDVKRFRAWKT